MFASKKGTWKEGFLQPVNTLGDFISGVIWNGLVTKTVIWDSAL